MALAEPFSADEPVAFEADLASLVMVGYQPSYLAAVASKLGASTAGLDLPGSLGLVLEVCCCSCFLAVWVC